MQPLYTMSVGDKRKWLLQQDLHGKVYVLASYKYCSFAGVVTCVGEQYISDAQHGSGQTEVSECDVTVQWV